MNESTSPANSTSDTPRPAPSAGRVLSIVLPIALVLLTVYWWSTRLELQARSEIAPNLIGRIFISEPVPTGGPMAFPDKDNDMLADPPSDAVKLINPDTLVFSYVATEESDLPDEMWSELIAAIKAKTGKEVKITHYPTSDEQLAAMKAGELHIAGMNTGLVQLAVEQYGFVPFCTKGQEDGTWGYTMEFLVPAGSPIKKLEDIKGHKVMFTTLDSNSGCKAPLVLLKEKYNLLPERDYTFGFSQGHKTSIKALADKEKGFDVAPVASDVLAGMIDSKEIDPASVVSIYKSERFPPATIGYAYNLPPELRDGIRETFLKFDWKGTGLEKEKKFAAGSTKFVPVNYKDDWANTRRIDQVIAEARKSSSQNRGS
jgi:phosphonate transport system substrate-binding protein